MKPLVSVAWIVFAGFASYKSLDALGVMDLPFNLIPWFMITGVFVIGGIKIINDLFTENEDNLNQEQYFKDVDRDSVDHKNNNNRFRFRSSNYLFVTMQKKTSLSPMSRYSVDRRKKVRICNNKQARH